MDREARSDRFTEVEDRYAGYTVYDQDYEKIGKVAAEKERVKDGPTFEVGFPSSPPLQV